MFSVKAIILELELKYSSPKVLANVDSELLFTWVFQEAKILDTNIPEPQCSRKVHVGHWILADKNFKEFIKRTLLSKKLKIKYWDYFLTSYSKKWGQNPVKKTLKKNRWEMRLGTSRSFVNSRAWLPFQVSGL